MNFVNFLLLFCGISEFKIFGGLFVEGIPKINISFSLQTCGKVLVGRANILGGNYAVKGAFPWVAVLMNEEGDAFCGGTLLTKNKVLTAAHCIKGKDDTHEFLARDITVILGAHNLTKSNEPGKISFGVQNIDIHRDWNTKSASFDADIAVLTLTDNVAFSRYIQPICLMDLNSEPSKIKTGFSAGYGKSEKDTKNENILKSVETPIANSNEECFYTNEALVQISSIRTFCGGSREGMGVCLGDSGNGLFVLYSHTYYLRGIVSASLYTNHNCDVHNHAIFTDVLKFNDWIVERIDQVDRVFIYGSSVTFPLTTTPKSTTTTTTSTTQTPRQKPSIYGLKSRIEATEGTDFTLQCDASGSPNPIYHWTRVGRADNNVNMNGKILSISGVSFQNSGRYTCEAVNTVGKDSKDVFLVVRSASSAGQVPWDTRIGTTPSTSQYLEPPKQVKVALGSKNEFSCSSDGNFRLVWRRADGQSLPLNAINYNGKLIIDNTRLEDAGLYECIATDSYGNSAAVLATNMEVEGGFSYGGNRRTSGFGDFGNNGDSFGDNLGIGGSGPPKITLQPDTFPNPVTAGSQFWIRCIVSGSEPMNVRWAVLERSASSTSAQVIGNMLKFDRVLMSDEGKYACVASNSYGSAQSSFALYVTSGYF